MSSLPPSAVMGMHRFDIDDAFLNTEVNVNTDKLDLLPPTVCTSSTRPATNLFQGRLIYETDTKNIMMYDLGGTPGWRYIGTEYDMPVVARGYFINSNKSVTATTWTDVTNDTAKSIVVPTGKKLMLSIHWRVQYNGNAGTALSVRLAWSGATTGNSYDQQDSGILGAMSTTITAARESNTTAAMFNAGTTTFKLQAQRANTSNATSIDAAAITALPVGWGDAYDPAAT